MNEYSPEELESQLSTVGELLGESVRYGPILRACDDDFPTIGETPAEWIGVWAGLLLARAGLGTRSVVVHAAILRSSEFGRLRSAEGDSLVVAIEESGDREVNVYFDPIPAEDETATIGILALEVARLWRSANPRSAHMLDSVAAVGLGFGLLVANIAERRTTRLSGKALAYTQFRDAVAHTELRIEGGLVPVAFALAAQLAIRPDAVDYFDHMSPNVRRAVDLELERIETDRSVAERLSMAAPALGTMRSWDPHAAEFDVEVAYDSQALLAGSRRAMRHRNAGMPVFRVFPSTGLRFHVVTLLAPTAVGASIGFAAGHAPLGGVVGLAVGAVVLSYMRRLPRSFKCSDPDCQVTFGEDEEECPGCGGEIRGEITNRAERLAAEDALSESDGWYGPPRRSDS